MLNTAGAAADAWRNRRRSSPVSAFTSSVMVQSPLEVGSLRFQLADEDVAEPQGGAVDLQFDVPLGGDLAGEHLGVIDDQLAIELHRHLVADHLDVERVPLAHLPV